MQCPSVPDEPGSRCDSPVRYFLHLEKSELHELSTAGCALSEGVSAASLLKNKSFFLMFFLKNGFLIKKALKKRTKKTFF